MHAVLLAVAMLFQPWLDYWWLTSWGSAHVLWTGNHNIVERFDSAGGSSGHVVDNWYPWFCQFHHIESGNAAGTPLRIYLAPPNGVGVSCYAAYNNHPVLGWTTNTGHYEGQQKVFWPAWVENWYVPGRDPASPSAYGTVIKIG